MSRYAYDDYDYDDRDRERGYRDPYRDEAPPHSGMGIASCIVGGLVIVFSLVLVVVAGIMEQSRPGGIDEDSSEAAIIGLLLFLNLGAALVGIVLGIVGAATGHRNKLFAGLGIGLNSLIFLGLIGLMIIGLAMS